MTNFKDLGLQPEILQILDQFKFTAPTPIQEKAIPLLIQESDIDFHGQAQTGTGKTLAFGLPLLHKVNPDIREVQALVIAPTRELAVQIYESLQPFAQARNISLVAIYGGVPIEQQIHDLTRGKHVVIGTPGRLNDHLRRNTLTLKKLRVLVLDEADIMLEMGFKEEIDEILSFAPDNRQIWLFSATLKPGIKALINSYMKDTISVTVSKNGTATTTTKQYYCIISARERLLALCRFIDSSPDFYGFIFCPTKILTGEIAEKLIGYGYNATALHGDMSQAQRNRVIKKFKDKDYTILVATDVAARGIDIANLTHVINYTLPQDQESYIHRIGRTGRAGKEGISITFINKRETRAITLLQRKFHFDIYPLDIPSLESLRKARIDQASSYVQELITSSAMSSPDTALFTMLNSLTREQMQKVTYDLLFGKFLQNIPQCEETAISAFPEEREQRISDQRANIQELSLNVGTDDGLTKDDVLTFIIKVGGIDPQSIQKLRVLKRRTFIEVSRMLARKLEKALHAKKLGKRKVRIEKVTKR